MSEIAWENHRGMTNRGQFRCYDALLGDAQVRLAYIWGKDSPFLIFLSVYHGQFAVHFAGKRSALVSARLVEGALTSMHSTIPRRKSCVSMRRSFSPVLNSPISSPNTSRFRNLRVTNSYEPAVAKSI
jgi:hypothetical protein